MKSLISFSVFAVVLGLGLGAVLAYIEVPPAINQQVQVKQPKLKQQASVPTLSPKAEVPETVFEFGSIEQGASMSHVFKIRNVGKQPLHVEVESTTCKCTVGDLSTSDIAPGEEGEVLLEWVAKTGPGPFRHGAVLSSNDPTQSSINLSVEGQVVESTAMWPSELAFGSVRTGESSTAELYLLDFLDQDLKVLGYEISDEQIAQDMEIDIAPALPLDLPSPNATAGLKVTATFRSGNMVGPFRAWLTLSTNLAKAEKLTVPIMGTVVGDLSIFGTRLECQKRFIAHGVPPGERR